jgi:hypothetical protein
MIMEKIRLKDLVTIKKIDNNYSMFEYYQFDYKNLSSQLDQYDSIYPTIQKISYLNHEFINNDIICDNIIKIMLKNKKYKLKFDTRKNIDCSEIHHSISSYINELAIIPYQHNINVLVDIHYIDIFMKNNMRSWFIDKMFYQDKYKDKIIIFDLNENNLFHNDRYYGFDVSHSIVIDIIYEDELRLKKLKRVLYE